MKKAGGRVITIKCLPSQKFSHTSLTFMKSMKYDTVALLRPMSRIEHPALDIWAYSGLRLPDINCIFWSKMKYQLYWRVNALKRQTETTGFIAAM